VRALRTIGLIVVGVALLTGLAVHVYWWDVAGSERPNDETLIKTLAAHRAEFDQARCGLPSSDAAQARLRPVGVKSASCDHHDALRLGFGGNTLGLAIGPGWAKGLTYIPSDPNRRGRLIASTDGAHRLSADVYLRPIGGGWFIWFQRDDD
jgi:hypothetical protein